MYIYPASDLDRPGPALLQLGTFWAAHPSAAVFTAFLSAQDWLANDLVQELAEWWQALEPRTAPLALTRRYVPLALPFDDHASMAAVFAEGGLVFGTAGNWSQEGQVQQAVYLSESMTVAAEGYLLTEDDEPLLFPDDDGDVALIVDTGETVSAQSRVVYRAATASAWPLGGRTDLGPLADRLDADQAALRLQGIDYQLDPVNDRLLFRQDPLEDDRVVKDSRSALLWAGRERHPGRLELPYRRLWSLPGRADADLAALSRALGEGLVRGASRGSALRAAAACYGVTLPEAGEVVELVQTDRNHLVIVTDRAVHLRHKAAVPLVAAGDVLGALGDLADDFRWSAGRTPPDWLGYLDVPPELLEVATDGALRFRDEEVAWAVSTDVTGATEMRFDLDAPDADQEAFWAEVQRRGLAGGTTLARYLDRRSTGAVLTVTQPAAAQLPATVNPLEFLLANLLSGRAVFLRLRRECRLAADAVYDLGALVREALPLTGLLWVLVEDDLVGRWQALNRLPSLAELEG